MNYDPVRWCFECRLPKPRAGFAPLPSKGRAYRWACADCHEKIMAKRERVKEAKSA